MPRRSREWAWLMYTGRQTHFFASNRSLTAAYVSALRPTYRGNHEIKHFTCLDQYRCIAFAQLTCREGLRDIETCLRTQQSKLCHMGISGNVSRCTLAFRTLPGVIHSRRGPPFFVIRAGSNLHFRRVYSNPVDKQTGIRIQGWHQSPDSVGLCDR